MAIFLGSVFILGLKLINPTSINIYMEESEASITKIPGFFTYIDVMILVASSLTMGLSGAYILLGGRKPVGEILLEERKCSGGS